LVDAITVGEFHGNSHFFKVCRSFARGNSYAVKQKHRHLSV